MCAGSATHSASLSDCVSVGQSVGVSRAAVGQEAEQEESSAVGQTPPLRHQRANHDPPPPEEAPGHPKAALWHFTRVNRTHRERGPVLSGEARRYF